jgi:Zn-dependent alcohol dehydrogenase
VALGAQVIGVDIRHRALQLAKVLGASAVIDASMVDDIPQAIRELTDHDADSDGADFLTWQRQLGSNVTQIASSQTVPEPSGVVLATIGLLGWTVRARRTLRRA